MNLATAHRKARAAVKRREEEIEQDELEGGEINLIPYLDIVTNLMLFLLASISSGLILGQLDTSLPDRAKDTPATAQPDTPPDAKPLPLILWVSPKTAVLHNAQDGTVLANSARLPAKIDEETKQPDPVWRFDFRPINEKLYQLAGNWKGKQRALPTYQIRLAFDPRTPYETIIAAMDAVRCKMPAENEPVQPCLLPQLAKGEDGKPVRDPNGQFKLIGPDGKEISEPYDPDTMALFHRIILSQKDE